MSEFTVIMDKIRARTLLLKSNSEYFAMCSLLIVHQDNLAALQANLAAAELTDKTTMAETVLDSTDPTSFAPIHIQVVDRPFKANLDQPGRLSYTFEDDEGVYSWPAPQEVPGITSFIYKGIYVIEDDTMNARVLRSPGGIRSATQSPRQRVGLLSNVNYLLAYLDEPEPEPEV